MSNGTNSRKAIGFMAGLAALFGGAVALSGCYGAVGATVPVTEVDLGVPVTEVDVVPVAIETYPHVYYRGSYAYLVDGRWYYRDYGARRGWVVLRREPTELARYRSTYVRSRRAPPGYAYPPERRRIYRPYRR